MDEMTGYHSKYFANLLTLQKSAEDTDRLFQSIFNAQIDINPHQVEAALFAFKSPLFNRVILADEVGLGKTIEAGLVLCQYWSERKRRLLIIAPASLRKQWSAELKEKFFLDSIIIDGKSFKEELKREAKKSKICRSRAIFSSSSVNRSVNGDASSGKSSISRMKSLRRGMPSSRNSNRR